MSDQPKNLERGPVGGTVTLDVTFKEYDSGPLVDPDTTPTVSIKNPLDVEVETGVGVKVSVGKYTYTYNIPTNAQVSSQWTITWNAEINGVPVPDSWEYFSVIPAGSAEFGDSIIISTNHLNRIKKVLVYPKAQQIILNDPEIKELCIFPAMEEYFAKFPIKTFSSHVMGAGAELDLDFPESFTFGATDIRFVGKEGSSGAGGSSFWDIYKHKMSRGGIYGGAYGTNFNFGSNRTVNQEQAKQTMHTVSNIGTFRRRVDLAARKVRLFANASCTANITWAKYSLNFSDVKFERINDVIWLCQANLLEHFAQTTQIVSDNNAAKTIDASTIMSNADTLRSRVMEKWEQIPDMIVIRN